MTSHATSTVVVLALFVTGGLGTSARSGVHTKRTGARSGASAGGFLGTTVKKADVPAAVAATAPVAPAPVNHSLAAATAAGQEGKFAKGKKKEAPIAPAPVNHSLPKSSLPQVPAFMASLANKCQCKFSDVCTCSGAVEFMNCIANACHSNSCDCSDFQFLHACGSMQSTCPNVGLQCTNDKASCLVGTNETHTGFEGTKKDKKTGKEAAQLEADNVATAPSKAQAGTSEAGARRWRWISVLTYVLPVVIFAWFYDKKMRKEWQTEAVEMGAPTNETFRFGLFSCFEDWRMTLMAFFCGSVRWADTVDKTNEQHPWNPSLTFWNALAYMMIIEVLYLITYDSQGIARIVPPLLGLVALATAVVVRQRLRKVYHAAAEPASAKTWLLDTLTYCCCSCCAVIQEAREVEYWRTKGPRLP